MYEKNVTLFNFYDGFCDQKPSLPVGYRGGGRRVRFPLKIGGEAEVQIHVSLDPVHGAGAGILPDLELIGKERGAVVLRQPLAVAV